MRGRPGAGGRFGEDRAGELERALEKLEVLDGSRTRKALPRAAVRIEDLLPLLKLPDLKSASVSGDPTQAQHNALVDDLHVVRQRLDEIALLLKKRLRP